MMGARVVGGCTRVTAVAALALSILLSGGPQADAVQTLDIDQIQVTFPSPSPSDFDAGGVEKLSANTLTVESDVDWKVSVLGTATTWSCSGATCWTGKPRTDIQWREAGSSYSALSGSAAVVKTGIATTPGTEDIVIDYRILLDWTDDAPGTYSYDFLVYEVSAL